MILRKLIPVFLILSLLTQCFSWLEEEEDELPAYSGAFAEGVIPYSEMKYVRPDPDETQKLLEKAVALSAGTDAKAVLDVVYEIYDAIDWYNTCYALADIAYNANPKDRHWEEEYNFCTANAHRMDQMIESLYSALAQSPCRKQLEKSFFGSGFFAFYDGESMWDDTLVALMDRESELVNQYYTQSSDASGLLSYFLTDTDAMAQTLVDLILVRHKIADSAGFSSYEDFANDFYYYRDYDSGEMDAYLDAIARELVPLAALVPEEAYYTDDSRESQSFRFVRNAAKSMGGTVWDAFTLMESAGLYDIAYSDDKFDISFELYLYSYQEPFLFMNPVRTTYDHLTMAHEFGHFCNDYASMGTAAGIDVCEVFSQAMEYLCLVYGENTEKLALTKIADSLDTYIGQAAYAWFEEEMYRIPPEKLSVKALKQLYARSMAKFGYTKDNYDDDDFVYITHFYTSPMYISSYIISNDAAMQIYQMELDKPGAGLRCLEKNLDTEEVYFLAFLRSAGLESPFAPGRLQSVRRTFEHLLAA